VRIRLRARRQQRRRLHPYAEGQGGRTLPGEGGYPRPEIAPDTGKRVGVIGSGPSSLTAAYYLRTYGHQVEVFEALEHAGGQLRYGIPAYRLPPDLLDREIDQIRALGVQIHTGTPITSLEDFRKDYDAVFLGLGTQRARLLPVEGAHYDFVLGALISCTPCAAASRCGLGRGWSSSAAATSRLTSP